MKKTLFVRCKLRQKFDNTDNNFYQIKYTYCLFAGGSSSTLLLRQTARLGLGRIRVCLLHLMLLDIWDDTAVIVGQVVDETRHKRPVIFFILSTYYIM